MENDQKAYPPKPWRRRGLWKDLDRLKLLKCFMAFIAIVNGAAQGGAKGIFQFGIGAIAPRAGGVFQYL